eukprot:gene12628-15858_t
MQGALSGSYQNASRQDFAIGTDSLKLMGGGHTQGRDTIIEYLSSQPQSGFRPNNEALLATAQKTGRPAFMGKTHQA